IIRDINEFEKSVSSLSDEALRAKTDEFRKKVQEEDVPIDDILPEAFAVCREAAKRTLNMRHFDVQLIGGIALHRGQIAEMKTGEGKTLVATLPVYLNSFTGNGVHLVTVNDYLARRDSEWMGKIYNFLGLKVGSLQHDMPDTKRYEAYRADVIYGTNSEFGFDYLRDNMKYDFKHYVQTGHHFAIVDEVDSILIDEARTPLIISGPAEESTDKYYIIDKIIPRLKKGKDFEVDEKARSVFLLEDGIPKVEGFLNISNLYDPQNMDILHHVNQALRAHSLFKLDVDYVVKEGQVIIVDEFTGRLMFGRRYSDGLHQALEAKERVKIASENQTLATITLQNYFRLYKKLAGMTGTADTEAKEFWEIYKLPVMVIPPNKILRRDEMDDVIYGSLDEKFEQVVEEIKEMNKIGRPVLVGTISIENSERISKMLKKEMIPHHVLNAKHHEQEAEIVAQAGQGGAVTIATNMAGRGTDIILGESVANLGGLHIIGTERHEARRIDNQLRGRAGRQGDPGSSKFYLSLEDDLLRIFGSDRIKGMMTSLGMEKGQPIEHKWISRAIESAQKKVEGHNFDIRKHTLEYDDVMNKQREVIYEQRKNVLAGEKVEEIVQDMIAEVLDDLVETYCPKKTTFDVWDLTSLEQALYSQFGMIINFEKEPIEQMDPDSIFDFLHEKVKGAYKKKGEELGPKMMSLHQRMILLQVIDTRWKDHLLQMDHLKEGIGLRGYGQRDPLVEFKKEGYDAFEEMIWHIKKESVRFIMVLQPVMDDDEKKAAARQPMRAGLESSRSKEKPRKITKIGRNDPCPCGSGKKFKKCCGV
ncbi:preprotein translocase subunit SecA, partial [bacterium]|nr:preprotein translocase subunit SecA [bacterium]